MASIAFNDLLHAVEEKYEPLELTLPEGKVVRLLPILRLSDEAKDRLVAHQGSKVEADKAVEAGEDSDFDMADYLTGFIRIVADPKADDPDVLFDTVQPTGVKVGRDLATLSEIVSEYSRLTQPGEASPSEN